jgi:benzoate membrane transport protein
MMTQLYEGTSSTGFHAVFSNLKSFPKDLSLGSFISGLLVVLVAVTGPVVIQLTAADKGNLTRNQTITWIFITWFTAGFFGLFLSLRFRMPMIGSPSTASMVLLVTSLQTHSIQEAVASYIIVAIGFIVIGATGAMDHIMKFIPHEVIMAMLAGVLFQFGVNIFTSFTAEPWLVAVMVVVFFIARRMQSRTPVVPVFIVGLGLTAALGKLQFNSTAIGWVSPELIRPDFTLASAINLALPMLLATLATQYAPGFTVLKNASYKPPIKYSMLTGGIISLITAPFGNTGVNTSTITANIAVGEHADPDRTTRYTAGVVCGAFYILAALFTVPVIELFSALPAAMMAAIAGLALLPALANSLHESVAAPSGRENAMVTLLITISGIAPLGLGSPFWGLCAGIAIHAIPNLRRSTNAQ